MSTRKVAVKKNPSASRKTSSVKVKPESKKPVKTLVYAADPHSFWTTDGAILNSLVALRNALSAMDKEVFSHHVAKGKNDFADWVEVILLDKDCAQDLRKAKSPATACVVVEKHLTLYYG
jgi:hypothetical protein